MLDKSKKLPSGDVIPFPARRKWTSHSETELGCKVITLHVHPEVELNLPAETHIVLEAEEA